MQQAFVDETLSNDLNTNEREKKKSIKIGS